MWLAGGGLQVSGWVLQALALDTGSLIVVQSLTTMSLVIALPLGARITSQDITGRVWLGAAAMVAGIVFASAVVGFVLQQSALKTSILAPAMASSNAVTLFGSVAFGVTVFGEKLSSGQGRTAPALIGLAIALAGIVLLAGAKPPRAARMTPATDRSPARR